MFKPGDRIMFTEEALKGRLGTVLSVGRRGGTVVRMMKSKWGNPVIVKWDGKKNLDQHEVSDLCIEDKAQLYGRKSTLHPRPPRRLTYRELAELVGG